MAPSSSSEENIILVGDHTDLLHNAYPCTFEEEGVEYGSVIHYCYGRIMAHLNLADERPKVLEALPLDVPQVATDVIKQHLPAGFAIEQLNDYLTACKDAFMRQGLQLRFQSDASFQRGLMDTGQSLLVVCDPRDTEFGVGMDAVTLRAWTDKDKINPDTLYHWMLRPGSCPHLNIGQNKLGMLLMWVRSEALKSQILGLRSQMQYTVDSLTVSDQIISLSGIFRPLSNLYALPIFINAKRYRSVEHFVYNKLFRAINLDRRALEKIKTTPEPGKVYGVATRIIEELDGAGVELFEKYWTRMNTWYHRAMRVKLTQYPTLKRLLLATGDSLLIETANTCDKEWSMGTSEQEVQHLLTKRYLSPGHLLKWMLSLEKTPPSLSNFGFNKTGLYLMHMRKELKAKCEEDEEPLPLMAVPCEVSLRSRVSPHLIAFTAESIFHPLYPSVVKEEDTAYPTAQHLICHQAAKYFDWPQSTCNALLEAHYPGNDVSVLFGEEMNSRFPPVEQLYAWEYRDALEVVKKALRLRFEQNEMFLRALLDTGDALLIFCQRFLTDQSEWSIGMREKEMREWMDMYGINTQQLLELCMKPPSERPAFLGGNRLGLLLMQLRREFVLQGVFPRNLPELGISPDGILGSDSATENMDLYSPFDLLAEHNYLAIWPSPFLLSIKYSAEDEWWQRATARSVPEHVRAANDAKTASQIETVVQSSTLDTAILDEMEEGALRQLLLALVRSVRALQVNCQMQTSEIRFLNKELDRVRDLRRTMETLVLFHSFEAASHSTPGPGANGYVVVEPPAPDPPKPENFSPLPDVVPEVAKPQPRPETPKRATVIVPPKPSVPSPSPSESGEEGEILSDSS